MTDQNSIYKLMIEHIEDYAILHLDVRGNIQSWNKGADRIKGYSHAEIIGRNFSIFYTAEDQEAGLPEKIILEAAEKGRYQEEGWRVRKDGTKFWGNITITAHYDEQKRVTGFTKITHDLTEKKEMQETLVGLNKELEQKIESRDRQLVESEAKYRHLFAANPLPMWLFDLETFRFLDVNDIACHHYGYSREEFLSMSVLDIRTEEQKKSFLDASHPEELSLDDHNRGIWQHLKKDGTLIDVEILGHNIVFDGKNARIVVVNDITKRKLAEEQLKYNEARLQQAQEMAHFGHWQLDFSSGIAIWSDEACRIYGLDIRDNKQSYEDWLSFIHPDDLAHVMNEITAGQKTLSPAAFYHRIVRRDGTVKYLHSQSHFEFSTDGKPVGMYGVAHDVSEEASSKEKIIHARRLYSFISSINQTIVHAGNEDELFSEACRIATTLGKVDLAWVGTVDEPNKKLRLAAHSQAKEGDLEVITDLSYEPGGPVSQVLESGSYFLVNDSKDINRQSKFKGFVDQRGYKSFMILPIKKSGLTYATLHLFSSQENLFDPDEVALLEEVTGDISFALEVFDEKARAREAENSLVHSESNLRLMMDLMPQGIFVKDTAGKYRFVNKSFAALYGLSPKEVIAASLSGDLFRSREAQARREDDLEVIESNFTKVIPEEVFTGPTGEERIFHATKLPYFWGRHREKGILGILTDITEQKNSESERSLLLADIIQRNKNLEQFTYIISHNLRAPVANIIGLTDLLQVTEGDIAEEHKIVEDLSLSVKKLDGVIKDLNDILKVRHHVNETKEMVCFSRLSEDIRISIDNLLAVDDITLITDFSPINELYAIKSYMHSIFFNLISNSIKYRRQDEPLVVEIYSELRNNKVELTFRDNGLGMDLGKIGRNLYTLYKRFHSHIEGKGMGLYMVKNHVDVMGGTIEVESEVNKGTTFKITLNS